MKNIFFGMIALLMLSGASCSAQRVIPTDSTKQVVIIYDDVYVSPKQHRPYYIRPYHKGHYNHPKNDITIKKEQRGQNEQYRKSPVPAQYKMPRGHRNAPMQLRNNMGTQQQNRSNQIKKEPELSYYDLPMEDFIKYINYKE